MISAAVASSADTFLRLAAHLTAGPLRHDVGDVGDRSNTTAGRPGPSRVMPGGVDVQRFTTTQGSAR